MAATLRRQYSTTDSTSRGPAAVVICTVFTSFAFIIVGLRLFTRFIFVRSVGAEDWLVTAALFSSIVLTVLISEEVRYGMGSHFITLSPAEYTTSLKPFYVSILFYNLGLALVKTSIILQFLRIFIGPTIRRVCWTLLGIVITWIIFATFSQIFMCTPVAYFWDKRLNGTCINSMVLWFFNASFNIVTDLAILITPMPVLKSLQIPKRQKYGLMIIFAIGAFECVTSILRLHSIYVISVSTDITWDNVGAATWSSVEVNVGIICACLPVLKPFVKRFAPKLLGSTMSGTASGARRGSSVWPYASNRGTVLSSTPGDRTKGYPLESGVKSYQSDIFGMHKLESKSSESQAEEGHIKVVKVFEVQHHRHEGDSPGSSEFNLFTGANGRGI